MHNKRHSIKSAFWHIFYLLFSKRTLKITGVYKTSAISDVNDLPINCIGIVYGSALHRPTHDGTIYAIFCLGNENDNVKSQFGYTIGKDTVSYVYRNYNYQNQLWSDWKQITILLKNSHYKSFMVKFDIFLADLGVNHRRI